MKSISEIPFTEYDCMCWETDEHGKTLCCDPPECEIYFCPVKRLIKIIEENHIDKI